MFRTWLHGLAAAVDKTFINSAVVLAAGKGTRMGTLTEKIPKPMLPVRGRPMLEHILGRLSKAGARQFFVVVGYLHETIEQYFRKSLLRIEFAVQTELSGTGSAARMAEDFVANEPFLLTYGDILCEPREYVRCGSVLEEFPDTAAVLAVKAVDDPWQGAAVYEENGRIKNIVEKPAKASSTTHWNSAGVYAFRPVLFDYLERLHRSPRNEYELTSALDMMLEDGLELRISVIEGEWRDVGRPEDLAAVNRKESYEQ